MICSEGLPVKRRHKVAAIVLHCDFRILSLVAPVQPQKGSEIRKKSARKGTFLLYTWLTAADSICGFPIYYYPAHFPDR